MIMCGVIVFECGEHGAKSRRTTIALLCGNFGTPSGCNGRLSVDWKVEGAKKVKKGPHVTTLKGPAIYRGW